MTSYIAWKKHKSTLFNSFTDPFHLVHPAPLINSFYLQMIAKVEELNGQLERVSGTAGKIKEMRKIVEQFESILKD